MLSNTIKPPPIGKARWLLLLFHIPAKPTYLREKVRRRLQRLGALMIKQAVYALPNGEGTREDFEWLRAEIVSGGGEASLCEAHFVAGVTDQEVERSFRTTREADYRELTEQATGLREILARGGRSEIDFEGQLAKLEIRFEEIVSVDFFEAAGRDAVDRVLEGLRNWARQKPGAVPGDEEAAVTVVPISLYKGRTWVTRRGVFVDRIASAWLIRRFIDAGAAFRFVAGRQHEPASDEARFDMFDAEFTHEGDRCTFEVMLDRFAIDDPGLQQIAEIVHDLDLKDSKFGRLENPGIGAVLQGITAATEDDEQRIIRGAVLFDELLAAFQGQPEATP